MMLLAGVMIDYLIPAAALATALALGGRAERLAAWIAITAAFFSAVIVVNTWQNLELRTLIIDLAALTGFWWIALKSVHFWPYWVTGCQIVTVLVHLQALVSEPLDWAYGMLSIYLSIPIVLIIGGASIIRYLGQRRLPEGL